MSTILRRFRGPLTALIALIFSAGIAFAGQPESPGAAGRANAATHAGKTVPVQAGDEESEQDEDTETDSESSDHCTVDLTQDPTVLAELNHGSVVCSAAQQDPPEDGDFANHGAWVSSWAKQNHGHEDGEESSVHGNSHSQKD